jgi:hypothetical protein
MKYNIREHGPDNWGISNTAIVKRLELHLRLITELMDRMENLERKMMK